MMMDDLVGRVVAVTGAASGIGAASVRMLLANSANVLAVDKSLDPIAESQFGSHDGGLVGVQADLTTEEGARGMIEVCTESYGRLDGVVAAAGISMHGTVEDVDVEGWNSVLAANLSTVYLTARFALPLMRSSGGGSFVAVASQMGIVGTKDAAAYCASKGGVITLVKAMALDHAEDNIRFNSVCPGPTSTPMLKETLRSEEDYEAVVSGVPLGRIADAAEIASVILCLLSDRASYVTGASWVVDGGYIAA